MGSLSFKSFTDDSSLSSSDANNNRRMSNPKSGYVRRAHHAGSWYEDDSSRLDSKLRSFLTVARSDDATTTHSGWSTTIPRAIIAPHAGYTYSGLTAAYAYLALEEHLLHRPSSQHDGSSGKATTTTVVVLHPSHHVHLSCCAVSGATILETPLGSLPVDDELRTELLQQHGDVTFTVMSQRVDEAEHSGEMQYPYIARVADETTNGVKVLPIMVGSLSVSSERAYGEALHPILSRPNIFTIVSTDFCHWGKRFRYTPTGEATSIHTFIERLDRRGMDCIEMQQPGAFARYLKETCNTICGRHPIAVWLHSLTNGQKDDNDNNDDSSRGTEKLVVKFVKYSQSEQVKKMDESSVSYASAVARKCQ